MKRGSVSVGITEGDLEVLKDILQILVDSDLGEDDYMVRDHMNDFEAIINDFEEAINEAE